MVDLRPLLFVNSLMILLLITASFIAVNKDSIKEDIQTHLASETTHSKPTDLDSDTKPNLNEANSDKSKRILASLKQTEDASFAQKAIFADEQPLEKRSLDEAITLKTSKQNTPNNLKPDINKNIEPKVISFENTPPAKEVIKTGKLVVRSNVNNDTVLINGKPYGPTKLEVELTPGNYVVEVAKQGFQSWKASVDIRRGSTQKINATLEQFTKVAFAKDTWENNIKTGEGYYINEGKFEYTGSFVNGKFHGNGSIRYSNGMKYQGQWFEGDMQGNGTLTTTEGDNYIGELSENKFNGEGTLTKATGDIYTGFWIDSVLNGQGTLTTRQGLLYVGGFADNLFHGNGSLTYPDGGHYEGSFSNGMFHGKGVETYANGKKYVGQFIDGLYHGNGEILNPNGSKITGTFKDGKPFGKATLTTPEGEVFTARSSEPGVCYRQKSYRATECPELDGW
ncbi:MAG: hypothetical protein ACJAS1_003766 [Oleiphilaceae bacterium]|jgi:hypothetical protein